MNKKELLAKHKFAIECAINYYVKNQPTGISDSEYDKLEAEAAKDGLDIREIALSKIQGNRVRNQYIESVPKVYAEGSMFMSIDSMVRSGQLRLDDYVEPKYDGSGIACYYNNGMPVSVVTCGGSNKSSDEGGIDQTKKLIKYFPPMPKDILAIQCEVLVDMNSFERPRQIGNGIINSKNKYSEEDIDNIVRIRGFRYFSNEPRDFMDTLINMNIMVNKFNACNFSPGYVMTVGQFLSMGPSVVDKEWTDSPTGQFLIDGYVFYRPNGSIITAVKFKNAGIQESVEVEKIQWNDLSRTKDGFSSNVILSTPVEIRGSEVRKPSSNGVNNLLKYNITPGAKVSVTLRGSTIPCVDKVFSPGNGDFNWPVCKCGTQLGPNDIFGNNLKCPNPHCQSRIDRMTEYVESHRFSLYNIGTWDGFFIIDRIKIGSKVSDPVQFIESMKDILLNDLGENALYDLIASIGLTKLQLRNLNLVIGPAYMVLRKYIGQLC